MRTLMAWLAVGVLAGPVHAQQLFSELVGPLRAGPVQPQATLSVPYITWGGDVATFLANGGLETASGTIYHKHGLKLRLTPGDDFIQQVKDYMSGKSPFLRGTLSMLGQASEVIGSDAATAPVVILQLSWSAGDHIVARPGLKTLNDLKRAGRKAKIACQQGGPHIGLLYDALSAAQLDRKDVDIVFTPDLTGPNGAAEAFRKDGSIDACCVITPDMIGLTGGLESVGTGAEGTVKGAHVLVSTQQMSRSIADVYAVRADWYRDNRETVEKFVAGYLKATEELVKLRNQYETTQAMPPAYRSILVTAQKILGEEVLPTLEVDAHGLLLDCRFVGLPGQIAFFEQAGNLSGFTPKMNAALDMAAGWGYAKTRKEMTPGRLDYKKLAGLAAVPYEVPAAVVQGEGGSELFRPDALEAVETGTIVSFTIAFEPNQTDFPIARYRSDFLRALKSASTFGGATVVIQGHSDPTLTLVTLIRAGMENDLIRRTGSQETGYKYFLRASGGSKELDVTQTAQLLELIKSGRFESASHKPMQVMQAALNLSLERAQAVRDAVLQMARNEGINVNLDQFQPLGSGIADPVVSKPANEEEARRNMRVEFRIVRLAPETVKASDFDF
jgi:ABC-type nitrate/sulfonate/bicarbonate transport system substrate-binding protein/Arc/MetJ-type ribon-helix-helix transcriptional regulator